MNHSLSSKLQKIVERWHCFAPCLGANVSVYDAAHGYWNYAAGLKTLEPRRKLEPNEAFYIYSITKTFTAIVVLRLSEKGLISLEAPITEYLDGLKLPDSVTVERLLNHTGGVPSYTDLPDYIEKNRESPGRPWSFEYVIGRTCSGELDFNPGEGWHYSNTGYMLLLLMIESVTGKSFSENIDVFVINKLGLSRTYLANDIDEGRLTHGYCRYLNPDEAMEDITGKYNPWWCKTGLVVSTSLEITTLYKALFAGELINQTSLERMTRPVPVGQPGTHYLRRPCYGMGLMIDPENVYGTMYGHGGDGAGFNTWSAFYPEFSGRSVGLSVFCNTSMGGHPFYLVKEILNVLKNV